MVVDGLQVVSSGVLRGCGRQKISALATFVAFYIVGLPSGALFSFVGHVGLMGYWIGLAIALFVVCIISTTIVFRTDWETQVKLARKRVLEQR
jgi:MATE family multidrug resistance protein